MSTARLATLTSLACCSPGWLVLLLPVIAAVGGGVCLGERAARRKTFVAVGAAGGNGAAAMGGGGSWRLRVVVGRILGCVRGVRHGGEGRRRVDAAIRLGDGRGP